MLDDNKVPHIYNVIPGGQHDFKVWKSDLLLRIGSRLTASTSG